MTCVTCNFHQSMSVRQVFVCAKYTTWFSVCVDRSVNSTDWVINPYKSLPSLPSYSCPILSSPLLHSHLIIPVCLSLPHFLFICFLSLLSFFFNLVVQAATRTETNDLKELLDVSREYITAVRVKAAITYVLPQSPHLISSHLTTAIDHIQWCPCCILCAHVDAIQHPLYFNTSIIILHPISTRPMPCHSDSAADVTRSLELAAYFTHCNLQPAHLMLALKTAMALAFKNKVSIPWSSCRTHIENILCLSCACIWCWLTCFLRTIPCSIFILKVFDFKYFLVYLLNSPSILLLYPFSTLFLPPSSQSLICSSSCTHTNTDIH